VANFLCGHHGPPFSSDEPLTAESHLYDMPRFGNLTRSRLSMSELAIMHTMTLTRPHTHSECRITRGPLECLFPQEPLAR
jgi:hypothetical protein